MPPPTNAVKAVALTSKELGVLKAWIDQGAKASAVTEVSGPLPWRPVAGGPVPISAVALSPGGRFTAFARGNRVEVSEVASGRMLSVLGDPELGRARPVERSAGRRSRQRLWRWPLPTRTSSPLAGWRSVRLWRRGPQEIRRKIGALPEAATALTVSRDGRWMAAGDAKGNVTLWDTTTEKFEPAILKDHTASIGALAFSRDGETLVSTAEDRTVRVWLLSDRTVVLPERSARDCASRSLFSEMARSSRPVLQMVSSASGPGSKNLLRSLKCRHANSSSSRSRSRVSPH
jgi:hypothetical protein